MTKLSIKDIKSCKNKQKLTMITAYDALFAGIFDGYVDLILVGDSLNMSFSGAKDTLSLSLKQTIYHTKAVCNGAKNTFIVADMPFGSYTSKKKALKNATKIYRQSQADAVKLEGGKDRACIIRHLVQNSIAVMGHIGLMPQFVRSEGGYIVQRKENEKRLLEDALALEEAGVFCIVIEGVQADIAKNISQSVKIPTIGIGAGKDTDGQVLVWSDAFGFFEKFKPKFVRRFLNGADLMRSAVQDYASSVRSGTFPNKEESYNKR